MRVCGWVYVSGESVYARGYGSLREWCERVHVRVSEWVWVAVRVCGWVYV